MTVWEEEGGHELIYSLEDDDNIGLCDVVLRSLAAIGLFHA